MRGPVIRLQQLQHGLAVLRPPDDLLVEGARLLHHSQDQIMWSPRPALCLKGSASGVQGPAHAVQRPPRKDSRKPGRAFLDGLARGAAASFADLKNWHRVVSAATSSAQTPSGAPHSTRHRAAQTTGTTRSLGMQACKPGKSTHTHPFPFAASTTQPCKMAAAWLVAKTWRQPNQQPREWLHSEPPGADRLRAELPERHKTSQSQSYRQVSHSLVSGKLDFLHRLHNLDWLNSYL